MSAAASSSSRRRTGRPGARSPSRRPGAQAAQAGGQGTATAEQEVLAWRSLHAALSTSRFMGADHSFVLLSRSTCLMPLEWTWTIESSAMSCTRSVWTSVRSPESVTCDTLPSLIARTMVLLAYEMTMYRSLLSC